MLLQLVRGGKAPPAPGLDWTVLAPGQLLLGMMDMFEGETGDGRASSQNTETTELYTF